MSRPPDSRRRRRHRRGGDAPRSARGLAAVAYVPLLLTQPGWVGADTKTLPLPRPRPAARAGRGRCGTRRSASAPSPTRTSATSGRWARSTGLLEHARRARLGRPSGCGWARSSSPPAPACAYLLRTLGLAAGRASRAAAFVYALTPVRAHAGRPALGDPAAVRRAAVADRAHRPHGPRPRAGATPRCSPWSSRPSAASTPPPCCSSARARCCGWRTRCGSRARSSLRTRPAGRRRASASLTVAASLWWIAGLSVPGHLRHRDPPLHRDRPDRGRGVGQPRGAAGPRLLVLLRRRPARPVDRAAARLHPAPAAARRSPTSSRSSACSPARRGPLAPPGLLRAAGRGRHGAGGRRPPVGRRPAVRSRALKAFLLSDAGLAMRSLPRAVPLVALGLAVLLGAGVAARGRGGWPRAGRRRRRRRWSLVALLALPPLWTGDVRAREPRSGPRTSPPTGTRPPPTSTREGRRTPACSRCPAPTSPPTAGATPSTRSRPGLIDRPYGRPRAHPLRLAAVGRPAQRLRPGACRSAPLDPDAPRARSPGCCGSATSLVRSDLQYERYNTAAAPQLLALRHRRTRARRRPPGSAPRAPNLPVPERPARRRAAASDADRPARPARAGGVPGRRPGRRSSRPTPTGAPVLAGRRRRRARRRRRRPGLIDGTELIRYSASLDRRRDPGARSTTARPSSSPTPTAAGASAGRTVRDTHGYTETGRRGAARRRPHRQPAARCSPTPATTR